METWEQGSATGTVPPPPNGPPPVRALRRPTDDRVIFGVASGLARYLDLDPVLVRIAFVLLTVFGGSGVLLYLIGLIAMPEQGPDEPAPPAGTARGEAGRSAALAIGVVLVVVGAFSLVADLLPGLRDLMGPILLLGLGALVILWGGRR